MTAVPKVVDDLRAGIDMENMTTFALYVLSTFEFRSSWHSCMKIGSHSLRFIIFSIHRDGFCAG